jgi:hypothetical protein
MADTEGRRPYERKRDVADHEAAPKQNGAQPWEENAARMYALA